MYILYSIHTSLLLGATHETDWKLYIAPLHPSPSSLLTLSSAFLFLSLHFSMIFI